MQDKLIDELQKHYKLINKNDSHIKKEANYVQVSVDTFKLTNQNMFRKTINKSDKQRSIIYRESVPDDWHRYTWTAEIQ